MTDTVIRAKVDPALKDAFYNVCKSNDLTPSQAIRRFMLGTVKNSKTPNQLTASTLDKSQGGDDIFKADNIDDLFIQLEI
jgi:DNA-damage-inducible protein J